LLVSSNAVIDGEENQALRMILERALPSGVSVAFDVDWRPQRWGLPPESPPSAEVLRRIRPLVETAQLIHCSSAEADHLFGSRDPVQVHNRLPQRPSVLVSSPAGGLDWCIGGRSGRLVPAMLQNQEVFLARLLESLCTNPQLLGSAGLGIDAVADPDGLAEQLLAAARASARPQSRQR
jgi:sugar/nucleoside kinase (ribokinase family)